jgi:hypothetical protein
MLSNIFLAVLNPYVDEIIGDRQCWYRRNTSATDQMFCIRDVVGKWEYSETVYPSMIQLGRKEDFIIAAVNRNDVFYYYLLPFTRRMFRPGRAIFRWIFYFPSNLVIAF